MVVFLNYNEQGYPLKSEKHPSKSAMYRKLVCQVMGQHPGRAPWEFRGLHVGWALFLDRRRLRGFRCTDPCLLRAWGGLRLPPILKLFWCCLTTKVLQILSFFPLTIQEWCSYYESAVWKTWHCHGAAREPSGHLRLGSLQGGDPSGMTFRVGADGYSTTLAATSCSSHHQTAWFYFRSICWPITKAGGTTCEPLEHLIPAALCPRTLLPKASGAFSWQIWLHVPMV